jgi:hypothetical protein
MNTNPLDRIRHQVTTGDQRGARLALLELLEAEPDNTDAWALLATLLTDPGEQVRCYREILRITPGDRQAAAWLESLTSKGAEPSTEEDDLEQLLDDVVLPETGDRTPLPHLDHEAAQWPPEPKGFLNGLLDRLQGRTAGPDPEMEALALGHEEIRSAAGAISPELILRLAGGPLAPEERSRCHKCDAVVSRRDHKCPWCSAILPGAEEPE